MKIIIVGIPLQRLTMLEETVTTESTSSVWTHQENMQKS